MGVPLRDGADHPGPPAPALRRLLAAADAQEPLPHQLRPRLHSHRHGRRAAPPPPPSPLRRPTGRPWRAAGAARGSSLSAVGPRPSAGPRRGPLRRCSATQTPRGGGGPGARAPSLPRSLTAALRPRPLRPRSPLPWRPAPRAVSLRQAARGEGASGRRAAKSPAALGRRARPRRGSGIRGGDAEGSSAPGTAPAAVTCPAERGERPGGAGRSPRAAERGHGASAAPVPGNTAGPPGADTRSAPGPAKGLRARPLPEALPASGPGLRASYGGAALGARTPGAGRGAPFWKPSTGSPGAAGTAASRLPVRDWIRKLRRRLLSPPV